MTHWKLTLAYDGTPFRGWQVQPGLPTVQGVLADAIHRTTGERVLPQGSGRTDAGVHALGQVASFSLAVPIPAANFHNALNRCLPPSIRILATETVPPDFHARHSALRKTYEYRIFPTRASSLEPRASNLEPGLNPICPPILAPYVWPCPWPLDLAALNQAATQVLGTHDFTTFAAVDPDLTTRTAPKPGAPHLDPEMWVGPPSTSSKPDLNVERPTHPTSIPQSNIRTVTQSAWHADINPGLLVYRVTASGFLHHMVRNLVGTFVQCGAHRLRPDSIPTLLATRSRAAAGPTAPPTGLFLLNVEYPDLEPQT